MISLVQLPISPDEPDVGSPAQIATADLDAVPVRAARAASRRRPARGNRLHPVVF